MQFKVISWLLQKKNVSAYLPQNLWFILHINDIWLYSDLNIYFLFGKSLTKINFKIYIEVHPKVNNV